MPELIKLSRFIGLVLIGSTLLFASSCKEDDIDPNEDINNKLDGDWDAESFELDGLETIPLIFNTFKIEFDKQDAFNGETEWTLVDFDGATQTFRGDYEIKNSGMEIQFEGGSFANEEFDIDIDGDDLELSGTIGGDSWEIELERD